MPDGFRQPEVIHDEVLERQRQLLVLQERNARTLRAKQQIATVPLRKTENVRDTHSTDYLRITDSYSPKAEDLIRLRREIRSKRNAQGWRNKVASMTDQPAQMTTTQSLQKQKVNSTNSRPDIRQIMKQQVKERYMEELKQRAMREKEKELTRQRLEELRKSVQQKLFEQQKRKDESLKRVANDKAALAIDENFDNSSGRYPNEDQQKINPGIVLSSTKVSRSMEQHLTDLEKLTQTAPNKEESSNFDSRPASDENARSEATFPSKRLLLSLQAQPMVEFAVSTLEEKENLLASERNKAIIKSILRNALIIQNSTVAQNANYFTDLSGNQNSRSSNDTASRQIEAGFFQQVQPEIRSGESNSRRLSQYTTEAYPATSKTKSAIEFQNLVFSPESSIDRFSTSSHSARPQKSGPAAHGNGNGALWSSSSSSRRESLDSIGMGMVAGFAASEPRLRSLSRGRGRAIKYGAREIEAAIYIQRWIRQHFTRARRAKYRASQLRNSTEKENSGHLFVEEDDVKDDSFVKPKFDPYSVLSVLDRVNPDFGTRFQKKKPESIDRAEIVQEAALLEDLDSVKEKALTPLPENVADSDEVSKPKASETNSASGNTLESENPQITSGPAENVSEVKSSGAEIESVNGNLDSIVDSASMTGPNDNIYAMSISSNDSSNADDYLAERLFNERVDYMSAAQPNPRDNLKRLSPRSLSRKLENELRYQESLEMAAEQLSTLERTQLLTNNYQDRARELENARRSREMAEMRLQHVTPPQPAVVPTLAPAADPIEESFGYDTESFGFGSDLASKETGRHRARLSNIDQASFASYGVNAPASRSSVPTFEGAAAKFTADVDLLMNKTNVRIPKTDEEFNSTLDQQLQSLKEYYNQELHREYMRLSKLTSDEDERSKLFGSFEKMIASKYAIDLANIEKAKRMHSNTFSNISIDGDSVKREDKGRLQPAKRLKQKKIESNEESPTKDGTGTSNSEILEEIEVAGYSTEKDTEEINVVQVRSEIQSVYESKSSNHSQIPESKAFADDTYSTPSHESDPAASVSSVIEKLKRISSFVSNVGNLERKKERLEKSKVIGENMLEEVARQSKLQLDIVALQAQCDGIVNQCLRMMEEAKQLSKVKKAQFSGKEMGVDFLSANSGGRFDSEENVGNKIANEFEESTDSSFDKSESIRSRQAIVKSIAENIQLDVTSVRQTMTEHEELSGIPEVIDSVEMEIASIIDDISSYGESTNVTPKARMSSNFKVDDVEDYQTAGGEHYDEDFETSDVPKTADDSDGDADDMADIEEMKRLEDLRRIVLEKESRLKLLAEKQAKQVKIAKLAVIRQEQEILRKKIEELDSGILKAEISITNEKNLPQALIIGNSLLDTTHPLEETENVSKLINETEKELDYMSETEKSLQTESFVSQNDQKSEVEVKELGDENEVTEELENSSHSVKFHDPAHIPLVVDEVATVGELNCELDISSKSSEDIREEYEDDFVELESSVDQIDDKLIAVSSGVSNVLSAEEVEKIFSNKLPQDEEVSADLGEGEKRDPVIEISEKEVPHPVNSGADTEPVEEEILEEFDVQNDLESSADPEVPDVYAHISNLKEHHVVEKKEVQVPRSPSQPTSLVPVRNDESSRLSEEIENAIEQEIAEQYDFSSLETSKSLHEEIAEASSTSQFGFLPEFVEDTAQIQKATSPPPIDTETAADKRSSLEENPTEKKTMVISDDGHLVAHEISDIILGDLLDESFQAVENIDKTVDISEAISSHIFSDIMDDQVTAILTAKQMLVRESEKLVLDITANSAVIVPSTELDPVQSPIDDAVSQLSTLANSGVSINSPQFAAAFLDCLGKFLPPSPDSGYTSPPDLKQLIHLFQSYHKPISSSFRDRCVLLASAAEEALRDIFSHHSAFGKPPASSAKVSMLSLLPPRPISSEDLLSKLHALMYAWVSYPQVHGENLDSMLIEEVKRDEFEWQDLSIDFAAVQENVLNEILEEVVVDALLLKASDEGESNQGNLVL
ncbi:hypothetical protein HDU83_001380 [Entophlyctis luteolus]|nr:hypothetical protein HDU83_001380 [Entophlyctis luteolus]